MASKADIFLRKGKPKPTSNETSNSYAKDGAKRAISSARLELREKADNQQFRSKYDRIDRQHKFTVSIARLLMLAVVGVFLVFAFQSKDKKHSEVESVPLQSMELIVNEQPNENASSSPPIAESKQNQTKKRILLYSLPHGYGTILTSVKGNMSLEVVRRVEDWVEVRSLAGIPVWINRKNATSYGTGYAIVTAELASVFAKPNALAGFKMGVLEKGEVSWLISKNKDWFRVLAPQGFSAWVKAADLEAK